MMRLAAEAIALVAIILLAAALGYAQRGIGAAREVAAAQGDTARCTDGAAATNRALATVRKNLDDESAKREKQADTARAAIAGRDAQIAELNKAAQSRVADIQEAAHDDDCRALADLPVCARVAGRLWPVAPPAGGQPSRSD